MTLLHHAGLCPADIDRSLTFYRDGIGLDVLVDTEMTADMETLLGHRTEKLRTIFLGSKSDPDAGIVELLDLDEGAFAAADPQPSGPQRGIFLLSFQVDVTATLERLAGLELGGTPRVQPMGRNVIAATVVDPDGVMVELLPAGRPVLADQAKTRFASPQ